MMLQGGPPDTAAYYRVAYGWVVVVYAGYVVLLWWRARRVRAQLRVARDRAARASRGA